MENPYQTINPNPGPSSLGDDAFQKGVHSNGLEASSIAQTSLYSSKGWVRFVSVLGFIYFAIMIMMIFAMMSLIEVMGGSAVVLVFLLMLAMTVVIFMLALKLFKYASSIGRMEVSRNPADLENAMIEQMKFWRIAGIMVIIGLVFTILALLVPTAFA
jgi:hypothetical protein